MTKNVIVCACLLFGCVMAHAAPKQLNVLLQSGEVVSVKFDENSVIRFSDGIMNVVADSTTQFQVLDVDNFYFNELCLSDVSVTKADQMIVFNNEEGFITLSKVQGKYVSLLDVNGVVYYINKNMNEDFLAIPVPSNKGVYILKVDKQSYKIIKK